LELSEIGGAIIYHRGLAAG
jgi:hypothetical protein